MTVSPTNIERGFDAASLRQVGTTIVGLRQFNRRVKVVIEDAKASAIALANKSRTTAVTVDHPIDIVNESANDFRVRASFKRDIWGVPQPCYVEIYGLAPERRRNYQRTKNLKITVLAGYDPPTAPGGQRREPDAFIKVIGVLNAKQNNAKHDGPDWIMKFEGGDGARAYWGSRVNKSWAGGTPKAEIARELLQGLGKLGANAEKLLQQKGAGKTWKNGRVLNGRIAPHAAWILRELGLQHCIFNEEVILFPIDGTTQEVYEIGPDSGLVLSPEFSAPPHEGKPQLLKAKWLLTADSRPGALILLRSEAHGGQYRCRNMEHKIDTEGGDFYVDTELQALKGAA